jgi:hypothetical protein
MSLSLNGHNINSTDSGTTTNTITITNWSANDIIIVVAPNQISTSVSSITDNSGQGLSWAQRADSTGAFHIETWWARAPSNFSGTVTITVNYTGGTPTYNPLIVFAVSAPIGAQLPDLSSRPRRPRSQARNDHDHHHCHADGDGHTRAQA